MITQQDNLISFLKNTKQSIEDHSVGYDILTMTEGNVQLNLWINATSFEDPTSKFIELQIAEFDEITPGEIEITDILYEEPWVPQSNRTSIQIKNEMIALLKRFSS